MNQHSIKNIIFLITLIFLILPVKRDEVLKAEQAAFEKPVIKRIEVSGNSYFSDKKIKMKMSIKENKWYNLFKKRRFNKWELEIDRYAIDSLYHTNGFLQAKSTIDYNIDNENNVWLSLSIYEGGQTRLESFNLEGGLSSLAFKEKKELEKLKSGEPLSFSKLDQVAFSLKGIYANYGYPYCQVNMEYEISNDSTQARVNFYINPDEEVKFGEIYFEGFSLTDKKVAERELIIKRGEIYSRERILKSEQRVYSTGLFNYLSLEAKNIKGKPKNPDFVLKVVERKPSYVGIKLGLGQYQPQNLTADLTTADLTLEWGNRNLAGSARKINISAFTSFVIIKDWQNLSNRFKLGFVEPWFLGTRTPFDFDLYYEPGVKSIIQPYRIESYGGNFNFSREYNRDVKFWLTFSYQGIKIYGIPPDKEEEFKMEKGINIRRKMSFSVEKDTRSNPFIPTTGSYFLIYNELVGGFLKGDNHFYKTILTWNRYNPLGEKGELDILATRVKIGYVQKLFRDKFVPTFDRFYAGGAYTIRGYLENTLGPKDSKGENIGGGFMMLANSEIRRNLFWKFGYTVFLDAGNVWAEPKDFNFSDIRVTAGAGLQFFTPVGPIRLDYARRIIRDDDPSGGRFHLAILYAF
ncbi:MAG: outer membrane protein assembly factor BamA [candidate division Zixibacteria bacterium]|nr:outer membrane protein assembly factor BamA [candidate division Zixibacteria bacterium]